MKHAKTKKNCNFTKLILMIMVVVSTLSGCKKNELDTNLGAETNANFEDLNLTKNPYSVSNVREALSSLGRSDENLNTDRIYYYYKFDHRNLQAI